MSVAIAHEHYRSWGGAEALVDTLARQLDCPIYAGMVVPGCPTGSAEVVDLFGGSVASRVMDRSTLVRDLSYVCRWPNTPELHDYDVVVQSGNNPGWYVPRDRQAVVKYVHSPPRNPYDRLHEVDSRVVEAYSMVARMAHKTTVDHADVLVFNSELTARRGELYWGVDREDDDVMVVNPPIDIDAYDPDAAIEDDDFYLALSRLVKYKRVGEIIDAFSGTDEKLVVAGDGPKRDELEERAGDGVDFVGFVSEPEKRRLMAEAKAGVFAAENEDFGMVPVEFLASGTPVIGVNEGYTKHQIEDGRNGMLYDRGGLREAVTRFESEGVSMTTEQVADTAERYSVDNFESGMRDAIERAEEKASIGGGS